MNLILILLALIDAVLYGYYYEKKKSKLGFLFWEVLYKGRTYVPVYRLLQGILDITAFYLVYTHSGLSATLGMSLAWYLMLKEGLYYIFMKQWKLVEEFEQNNTDVYWLKRFYFSGWWLFRSKFTQAKFWVSCITGLAVLILSNFLGSELDLLIFKLCLWIY